MHAEKEGGKGEREIARERHRQTDRQTDGQSETRSRSSSRYLVWATKQARQRGWVSYFNWVFFFENFFKKNYFYAC